MVKHDFSITAMAFLVFILTFNIFLKFFYSVNYGLKNYDIYLNLLFSILIVIKIQRLAEYKLKYYLSKLISRIWLIFIGSFFSYLFFTKKAIEVRGPINLPKIITQNPFQLFDWSPWFLVVAIIYICALFSYSIYLEDVARSNKFC